MKKKTIIAAIIILTFSISLVVGVQVVKADSNASMTFSGGVTIYCPLNETYGSNYLTLNLTVAVAAGVQTSFDYSIDGVSQGSMPLVFSYGGLPIYYENGIVALPELSAGLHTLTIFEQCILPDYHGANAPGALFKQVSPNSSDWIAAYVDAVYFSINSSWTPTPAPSIATSTLSPAPSLTSSPTATSMPTLTPSSSPLPSPSASSSLTGSSAQEPAISPSPSASPPLIVDYFPNYPLMIQLAIVAIVIVAVAGLLVYFKRRGPTHE